MEYQPRRPQPGEIWGYRTSNRTGAPLVPAEVLQLGPSTAKHKLRVRYLGGEYSGLDEWIPKGRLKVKWEDAEVWLYDETSLEAAFTVDREVFSETYYWATDFVCAALPTPYLINTAGNSRDRGVLEIDSRNLVGACELLQVGRNELLDIPHSFVDRFGTYRAPFSTAIEMARRLCALYPDMILNHVGKEEEKERRYAIEGQYFGKTYISPETCTDFLAKYEPSYALVREWCGEEAIEEYDQRDALKKEVQRLRSIIEDQIKWLDNRGEGRLSKRLRKVLENQS